MCQPQATAVFLIALFCFGCAPAPTVSNPSQTGPKNENSEVSPPAPKNVLPLTISSVLQVSDVQIDEAHGNGRGLKTWGLYLFSSISQKDPWVAHTVWRWRLLLGASTTLSIVSAALILWYRLLPGRPLSALIIAIIFATLILPATSMSNRQRRELVAENPFHGFTETTKQYIAFSGSLIVGCVVASDRKPKDQRTNG